MSIASPFVLYVKITDIFTFVKYYFGSFWNFAQHYFALFSIRPMVIPVGISLIVGSIQYLIIKYWIKINPKKYQDLLRVLFVNFIALILLIIFSLYKLRDDILESLTFIIIFFFPLLLLASIIEYLIIKCLKDLGVLKENRLLWMVILVNYITYSTIYIIFSLAIAISHK